MFEYTYLLYLFIQVQLKSTYVLDYCGIINIDRSVKTYQRKSYFTKKYRVDQ